MNIKAVCCMACFENIPHYPLQNESGGGELLSAAAVSGKKSPKVQDLGSKTSIAKDFQTFLNVASRSSELK